MAYKVIGGKVVNKSSSCGGCGSRKWCDDDVAVVSHQMWRKDARYKNTRMRKAK